MSVGKLPADPETWKSKAAALGVDNTNTQDLAQTASASKMPDKQFYALRVLWTRHKASEIEGVFLEQEYDGWAKEQMQKDTHWELLLSAVQSQMRPESTPFLPKEHKIGEYGDLYEAQYDIAYPDTLPNNDNDDNDDDDDDDNDDDDNEDNEDAYGFCRPKIWLLPKDSRQGYRYEEYLRKKGTEQPSPLVHAGTHKAAKAGASSFEMTGLMETLPQTPTQRTPQASLHYHLQTPTSAIIQQTPVVGTKAPDPGLQKTTESFGDEAKVEFALHLFMRKLLRRFIAILGKPKTKAQWEQTHVWLKFGDWVAVTDGHLKSAHNQTKAIVEVKPFSRNISIDRIRRQESGQMAAWIYSEPKEGLSQGHGRKWYSLQIL